MDIENKKVAVYGLGVTGKAVLKALETINLKELVIVNGTKPTKEEVGFDNFKISPTLLSENTAQDALGGVDIILLSPGIARNKESLILAHKNKVKVWNEIEWCSQGFNGPVIAVTGTNGKTTTVTFLDFVFKNSGIRVFTGGNIGVPFATIYHDREDYDLALLEMSSFQCESLESFRPNIAAYLNLYPNHGERYENTEDYRISKWKLVENQSGNDVVFTGPGAGQNPLGRAQIEIPNSWQEDLDKFIDWTQVKLVGEHNRQNIWFSWQIFSQYFTQKGEVTPKEEFLKSLYAFNGVEHRVEACGEFNGNLVFNDAKSTNWQASLSAVKAVNEKEMPIVLIVGGKLRGENDLPEATCRNFISEKVEYILGIGESSALLNEQWNEIVLVETLEGAKNWISEKGLKNHVILLSPAFPSFDQFKNYADRGESFKRVFSL